MYNALLVLHIIGVAVWLGANVLQGFVASRVTAAPPDTRAWWADSQGVMSKALYSAAGVVVLLTGIFMVLDDGGTRGDWEFSNTFVSIGFAAIVVGIALGIIVFGPGSRRLAEAIRSGDEATEKSTVARLGAFGALDSAVVVITIVAMVAKWGT